MSDENEKIAIQFSEDTSGVNPSDLNLTTSGTVDKEVYHGADAVAQVEANIGRPLSYAERRVVEEEGYVATPYTDTKGITM